MKKIDILVYILTSLLSGVAIGMDKHDEVIPRRFFDGINEIST